MLDISDVLSVLSFDIWFNYINLAVENVNLLDKISMYMLIERPPTSQGKTLLTFYSC